MKEKRNYAFSILIMIAVVMVVAVISADAETSKAPRSKRIYLKIGGDPKDPGRQLLPDEEVMVSTQDLWVVTNGKSGKVYRGWMPAGTEFVTAPTENPTLRKAVWIKKCGNDVLNPEGKAIYFRVQAEPAPQGRQIQEAPLMAPQVASAVVQRAVQPAVTPVTAPSAKQKCLGMGTWLTGLGSAMVSGGLAAGGWGYGVAAIGLPLVYFGAKDNDSDPACKAVAAVIGGVGGVVAGRSIYHHQHSSGGRSSSPSGPSPEPIGSGGPSYEPPGWGR